MTEFEGQSSNKVRADEMAEKPPYKKLKLRLKAKPVNAFTNKGNEEAETQDENDECKRTCPECFTSFHSVKSLHGHMRSHGDRKYRGMVPPEQKKSSHRIKTYSMDDQVVAGCSGSEGSSDLTGLWSREWPSEVRKPRTGCSGGTGVAASSSSVNGDEDKEEEELMMGAAYGLLLIATGDDTYKTLPSSSKDGIRVSEPNNKKARSDDDKMKDGVQSVVGKKRKREEEMRMMKSSYTCSICGKSFGSPKALGGHISSHASKKGCGGASLDPSHHGECVKEDVVAAASHVCKICDKEFRSGQALGGHMRFHNKLVVTNVAVAVVVEDQTPLSDVAIVEDEAPIAEVVRYCFDLNEIPGDDC